MLLPNDFEWDPKLIVGFDSDTQASFMETRRKKLK